MLRDLLELTPGIPGFMLVGFVGAAVAVIIEYLIFRKKFSWKPCRRFIIWFLFLTYLTAAAYITFYSREPGSRDGVDLELFGTWGASAVSRAYVIENVLLFIPFGFLLPAVFGCLRNWLVCTILGFVCSIALEYMQFKTGRGFAQLDDVVTNGLGTFIGYLGFVIVEKTRRCIYKHTKL